MHVSPFWSSLTLVSHGIASRLIKYSDRMRPFWASSEGDTPACFTAREVEELLAAVDGVRDRTITASPNPATLNRVGLGTIRRTHRASAAREGCGRADLSLAAPRGGSQHAR